MESSKFSNLLAAAAGEDTAMLQELRVSVLESAQGHLDLMRRSRCDANWDVSSRRLKSLAEAFDLGELAGLAETAIDGAPSDPRVLTDIDRYLAQL